MQRDINFYKGNAKKGKKKKRRQKPKIEDVDAPEDAGFEEEKPPQV